MREQFMDELCIINLARRTTPAPANRCGNASRRPTATPCRTSALISETTACPTGCAGDVA